MSGNSKSWTPERRAHQAEVMREQKKDPVFRERQGAGASRFMKHMHSDPAFEKNRIQKLRAAAAAKRQARGAKG